MATPRTGNKDGPEKDFRVKINGDFDKALRKLAKPIKRQSTDKSKSEKGRQK